MGQKEEVRAFYNSCAKGYSNGRYDIIPRTCLSYALGVRRNIILDMLGGSKGRILDLGCGSAVMTEDFLKKGCEVWGVDISSKMIEEAKKKMEAIGYSSKTHFFIGDAEDLNFPDEFFDVIISSGLFEYLDKDDLVLKQIHRVLKPNGIFIVSVPNQLSPSEMVRATIEFAIKLFRISFLFSGFKDKAILQSFRVKRYIPAVFDKLLMRNGFKKIDYAYFHFSIYPLDKVWSSLWILLSKKMERFSRSSLGLSGYGYVVKAIKTINNPIGDVKNILVMNLGGIGDVLLSIPALRAIRNLYPKGHIALLIVPKTKEVVEGLLYLDEIITFDIRTEEWRGIRTLLKLKKLKMAYRVIRALRKKKFDMIINFRAVRSRVSAMKAAMLFYGIGSKYRIGRDTAGGGFFLTHKMPETWTGQMHEIDYNLNLVNMLGANTDDRSIEFKFDNDDATHISDFLHINGITKDNLVIGINPSAAWPSKCWPIENWTAVIKDLLEKLHPKIIITGSPDEIENSRKLFRLVNNKDIIIATGKTTLKQLACLIKRCNLYITNDAGPMHIASFVNTPLIAIFGPGDLIRYRPIGDKDRIIILHREVECSPCKLVECHSLKCLKLILPQEVLDAAYFLLKRHSDISVYKEA